MNRPKTILAAVVISSACGRLACAQDFEYVAVKVPIQKVEFDDGGVGVFATWAVVRSDGAAFGRFRLRQADGTVVRYRVAAGGWTVDRTTREIGVRFGLVDRRSGLPPRGGFDAIAVATPDLNIPGCDIWDLMCGQVQDATFPAMNEIANLER